MSENNPVWAQNLQANLKADIKQKLTTLFTQVNNTKTMNSNLQKEITNAIGALLTENIALKQENTKLKTDKLSKS